MPSADLILLEQISTQNPAAARVFALGGVCSKGDPLQSYTFDPDASAAAVQSVLGDGKGVEALVTHLRYGKQRAVFFPLTPTIAGSIGAVTETRPGSPGAILTDITPAAIVAAGDVLIDGPYDSLNIAIEITETGINGVGKFHYSLDHEEQNGRLIGAFSGDIVIPAETVAEIIGTVDLGTIDTATVLNTLDLTVDSDSDGGVPGVTAFAAPATPAAVVSQLNANNGGGTKYLADLVGSNKLRIRSITAGTAGTLALSGTALSALGLGVAAQGADAIFQLPNTGSELTFATGNFVANDYYTFTTMAPKVAPGAAAGLFTRAKAKISEGTAMGAVWLVQDDADALEARAMVEALAVQVAQAHAEKFYVWAPYQSPHPDNDVITYLGDFVYRYIPIFARTFRSSGGALTGSRFLRASSWVGMRKAALARFSSDLGNHRDAKLDASIGMTAIVGDERTATTKLATFRTPQTGDGGGFCVLETMPNGGAVYFYRGRTMAQFGSILGDLNAMRLLLVGATVLQPVLDRNVNSDPPLRSNGRLVSEEAIKDELESALSTALFEDPEADQPHASAISVSLPSYSISTKTISVSFEIQGNAQGKAVRGKLGVVDNLTVTEV